jgi:FkbM family methyltransferase
MTINALFHPGEIISGALKRTFQSLPQSMKAALRPARDWMQAHDMRREVDGAANDIRLLSDHHRGPKIFVDCGFNGGRVMERFIHDLPDFKFYGFELNTEFESAAQAIKAKYKNVAGMEFTAVSNRDGETTFFLGGNSNTFNKYDGSTIVADKRTGNPQFEHPITTPTVDMARWVKDISAQHRVHQAVQPFVAVKMDIEGAEFDVLEHMLEGNDPAAHYIDALIVEFHAHHMDRSVWPAYEIRQQNIMHGLNKAGILVHEWV